MRRRVDMTPWRIDKDKIMEIARRKGRFCVPRYLYRAEPLAKKCRELRKNGLLRVDREQCSQDETVYVPVPVENASASHG